MWVVKNILAFLTIYFFKPQKSVKPSETFLKHNGLCLLTIFQCFAKHCWFMTLFILQMLPKLNRNKHLSTPTNTTRPRSFVLFMLHPEPKWLGSKMGLPCLTMREFWTIVATATLWFCLASKAPLLGNTSAKPQTNSDPTRKRRKFQVMKEKRISFVANLRLGLHFFFRFRVVTAN